MQRAAGQRENGGNGARCYHVDIVWPNLEWIGGEASQMRWIGMIGIGIVFVIGFVTAAVWAESAGEGRQLFFSQGCYGCHRVGVAGTPIANDLSHVGAKYTESELAKWLRDPAAQKPRAHMPRLALQEDEIRALAAYLATLK
jgi:mono/diheme cytochrome c family protein